MKKSIFTILSLILYAVFLQGHIQQSDKWEKDDRLKNIMILFLGKKYENRKLLENELTYYINEKGFKASPSLRYIAGTSIPDSETVISVLQENDFDGVFVVHVIDLDVKQKWVNAKMKYGNTPTSPYFYNYYSLSLQYSPGYSTQEMTYELESTLFRTSDKSEVFTTTSKTYNRESLDMAMESFAKTTANKLKRSKTLLRTK
jgi:hypothetical protein